MSSASVSSTERTPKRTTKVPVSEHRRLQLRLAQRAYRYRKDTITLSLQHRLEYLQTQIQNLHRTFQAYNHQIERSGVLSLEPALEGKLQQLRTQILEISTAATSSNENSSAIQMNEIVSTMTQARQQRKDLQESGDDFESTTSRPVNGGLHLARPISSFNSADRQENNPRGKTSAQSYPSLPTPTLHIANRSEPVPCAVNNGDFLDILHRSSLLSSSTAPFRETSFERRLHRACLKNGYNLLADPTSDLDNVSRVFRLPLTLSTRDSIVQKMKGLLEGGLDEAPELWDMPFFLLGGAGTHYPRRDRTGKPILPPNALPMSELSAFVHQRTGPQSFQNDHDLLADLGLNGEWLDSHDVEGYLKEKGIFLSADIAFCSVSARAFSMEFQHSNVTGANAQHVMGIDKSALGYMHPHNADRIETQAGGWGSNIQDIDLRNYTGPSGSWVLDVGLFIDYLIQSGICLGRCPGFRRKDVDHTFRLALGRNFLDSSM